MVALCCNVLAPEPQDDGDGEGDEKDAKTDWSSSRTKLTLLHCNSGVCASAERSLTVSHPLFCSL
jgi:hypothetical protein